MRISEMIIKTICYVKYIVKNFIRYFNIVKLFFRVRSNKARLKTKIRNEKEINVIFLIQYPEMWNSQKSLYEKMVEDDRYSVNVLAIPKRIGVNMDDPTFFENNEAYEFCIKEKINAVNAYQNGKWVDIKAMKPDYLFVQRTYDEYMPPEYRLEQLSKYALLCYIPYGYQFGPGIHLKTEYNINALNNLYYVFCENEDSYNYCTQVSKIEVMIGARKCLNEGYTRFDLLRNDVTMIQNRKEKTALWLPRWSADTSYDGGNFLNYYNCLKEYFANHSEYGLIIRPHPLMFNNFLDKGIMTKEEVDAVYREIENINNISFDTNSDYINTFNQSDILISDFSGLLAEFFVTSKPIIYCGDSDSFTSEVAKRMLKGFYRVYNKQDLLSYINQLLEGEDALKSINKALIDEMVSEDCAVSDKILNMMYTC